MPPKRGIVKSGNAGNSSKPSSKPTEQPKSNEEKPLFPPGFKYPLSLLNERCQKNGWERPVVDTRKQGNGFSFVVTLSRLNKRTSEKESVRLEPHPPYISTTATEARHWGATYALYRFCNGISLNRVLPPGPREYWQELAAEHKNILEHQKWMYDADPFAARKAVDERQAQAAKKREEKATGEGSSKAHGTTSPEFTNAPEVKMAGSLRDFVEEAIKKSIEMYPEAEDLASPALDPEDINQVMKQLETLGFTSSQARNATIPLSQSSSLASSLIASQPPLQACIEYLMLHLPECDLPPRFLPSTNSSAPFITAAHSGTTDLKARWMEERAVKECGWPAHIVKECMTDTTLSEDWSKLVKVLNCRLVGADITTESEGDRQHLDEEEIVSYGGEYIDPTHLVLPLPVAPIMLHILVDSAHTISTQGTPPPTYLTSNSVASYVRLHLLSQVLEAFRTNTLLEPGESLLMALFRRFEEEWGEVEDSGPPDMSLVLRHMLPQRQTGDESASGRTGEVLSSQPTKGVKKRTGLRKDSRSETQVLEDFERMRKEDRYAKMLAGRKKLPAFGSQTSFLKILKERRCVIVVGETGCGKTTQLPQFILDSMILSNKGKHTSIIITQPRRLSAIGVASRVSAERLEDSSVGYAIRGESKRSEKTKLLFCTTGVVLRRLAGGDKLQDVTHVIVDEVHERSVDGDLLLLELKEIMKHHPTLKVVLMSATINHEIFVKYFSNAPLLTIPGFTHPVEDIYVEDILPSISYRPTAGKGLRKMSEKEKLQISMDYSSTLATDEILALQTIVRTERVDFELLSLVVQHIVSSAKQPGGILIFLPGVQDIRQCIDNLRGIPKSRILPLHANLSSDDQRVVFEPFDGWKIIAATNVAETSITIDDVVYVVDCGRVKETQFNPEVGLTQLVEQWVTQAAARQRRGRAGRTQPGKCYKLYTRKQEASMEPFPIPEIKRVPLESVSLTVKVVHSDVKGFLARAIDPPNSPAVDHALSVLEEIGAITNEGDVTPMGQHLATLPVDLRLGKMLVLGTIFQCLDPVLTVAACLSSKPLFVSPMEKREEANRARERFGTGNSDLLTDAYAYDEIMKRRAEGATNSSIRVFCEENFINSSTIRDITSLRNDLFSSLSSLNFVPPNSNPTSSHLNTHSTNTNLVKAIILGGLWPRVARVSLPPSAIKFDKVQAGTIQRENTAKEFKFFDISNGQNERVFLHPASVLFGASVWKSPFVAYFQKQMTSKVFLRDATEIPMYALLLFGGTVSVNHIGGGLTIGNKANNTFIKLKAWPRIGVLVNQLRRLLDIQLTRCVEDGAALDQVGGDSNQVVEAMLALLSGDGLSG